MPPATSSRKKKKISAIVKLQIPAGQATPAPPVGTALGPHGVNIMEFVRSYNERTASQMGTVVPVQVTIYEDRSFEFVLKTPPASVLLKQAAKAPKGSADPNKTKVGTISVDDLRRIAEVKLPDLNAYDLEHAMRIIAGTARSMGVAVER
ncbi:MAG TPA: 50S ribosomal protein L11 [Actinomycetota bacterium]|nr:50S ribosomal protein L11 [Actinomycetota bacterium]